MNERLQRAVSAALAELTRQSQEGGEGAVYVYEDSDPRSVGVDGRMDLVAVIEATLKAARETDSPLLSPNLDDVIAGLHRSLRSTPAVPMRVETSTGLDVKGYVTSVRDFAAKTGKDASVEMRGPFEERWIFRASEIVTIGSVL